MNRFILAIFAFVIVVSSSCKKQTTIVSPDSTTINLIGTNWTTSDGGKTFTTSISTPEITNYYQTQGAVLLYDYIGNTSAYQNEYEQLPSVYDGITYKFSYNVGALFIDAQSTTVDTGTTINTPADITLKLVLVP